MLDRKAYKIRPSLPRKVIKCEYSQGNDAKQIFEVCSTDRTLKVARVMLVALKIVSTTSQIRLKCDQSSLTRHTAKLSNVFVLAARHVDVSLIAP